jgi:serine O-acetyltransferase
MVEGAGTDGAFDRLRADLRRYYAYLDDGAGRLARIRMVLVTEGIWALIVFRLGQYLDQEILRPLRPILYAPYWLLRKFVEHLTGIHLSVPARIGPGLYIGHYGGIWISPWVTIGANCSISHQVTIGIAVRAAPTGRPRPGPVLGDRVWVGPNATISGPVRIGSGAVIAANTLVVANVPENGVAVGVPARVISYTGSAHLLNLP